MGVLRSFSRPLLFMALMALIAANADVAEAASFLSGLRGRLKGMADKIKGLTSNVAKQTSKKFSVLSKFFGDGKARGDLTLPEIFNNVFSRSNSIVVGTSNDDDKEGQLGDGSSVIAAISTGGTISVTSNNGMISITTGTNFNVNNNNNDNTDGDNDSDSDSDNDNESNSDENNDEQEESENGGHVEDSEGADESGSEGNEGNDESVSNSENPEASSEEKMTFSGSDLDDAFTELLSDWESFVTSSIWYVQDNPELDATITPTERVDSLVSSSRVVNGVFLGNRIASGAPFAVKLFYNNEENFYCSGSLIGYPYALTAAHCGVVEGDEVRVGGRLLRSGYKATVAEIFTHPDFNPSSLVHDIAVIRLDGLESKRELIQNGVKAARINRNDSFPYEGFIGVLSGHGSVETDGQGISDELRSTRHSIYNLERCTNEITQGDVKDEESYLCAGDGERSTTCVGDSGAGLWHFRETKTKNGKTRRFFEVFGVVSFGEVADDALCPRGPPTVFQKTSLSSKWIQEVIGKKNMP